MIRIPVLLISAAGSMALSSVALASEREEQPRPPAAVKAALPEEAVEASVTAISDLAPPVAVGGEMGGSFIIAGGSTAGSSGVGVISVPTGLPTAGGSGGGDTGIERIDVPPIVETTDMLPPHAAPEPPAAPETPPVPTTDEGGTTSIGGEL